MNGNDIDEATPLIMVTNDDGIDSPGLLAAVDAALELGRVLVTAPTTQQTARGRALVGNREDLFHAIKLPGFPSVSAYHIDASPALTVRHALAVLCPDRRPDLVLSGINYGENLGNNITISGTLGAAFQAAAQGVPALAVSRQTDIEHHYSYEELDWADATRVTREWARRLIERTATTQKTASGPRRRLPFDLLKVDIPDWCPEGTEERITRLSRQPYFRSRIAHPAANTPIKASRTYIEVVPEDLDPLDDIYALAVDGVVSITPLQLDCSAPLEDSRTLLG